jgi:HEAT repeat protein
MPDIIKEILQSERKPKEKVALLTEKIKEDKKLVIKLVELLKTGTDVEKGTCAEIMKFVSKDKSEIVAPYIDVLIEYIDYKAPRVKWGIPESIGNLAQKYPEKVEKAIPKLLINTKDKSTVVRWCAAFALAEIAKYNPKLQKELISKFNVMVKTEQNNGVKNVYLKVLKIFEKKY